MSVERTVRQVLATYAINPVALSDDLSKLARSDDLSAIVLDLEQRLHIRLDREAYREVSTAGELTGLFEAVGND